MALMYVWLNLPPSTSGLRSRLLRLAALWLFKCFLPACDRFSRPVAVTRKRFFEALCVFILGMAFTLLKQKGAPESRRGSRNRYGVQPPGQSLDCPILAKIGGACRGKNHAPAFGASMAVMRLPSIDGAFSTLATSTSFSRMALIIRRPSST